MKLGFISDLHLSENMPSITEGFFDFLHTASQELSHLYILGDLFESWIGDDDDSEYALKVIKKINHASRNGLEIFFIHGNRDFLIGSEFESETGETEFSRSRYRSPQQAEAGFRTGGRTHLAS